MHWLINIKAPGFTVSYKRNQIVHSKNVLLSHMIYITDWNPFKRTKEGYARIMSAKFVKKNPASSLGDAIGSNF